MNHQPRRRFSQNFLIDDGIIAAIVNAMRPLPGENIVEIGPGQGALTRPLLERAGQVHAIEIDRDLAAMLERELAPRLRLHVTDVLQFDFSRLGRYLRVVGNLPYHISTPLLFHLVQYCGSILDIHVMLQKEVVERMVAAPGDSNYGRLSVSLQYRFDVEYIIDVPADAFKPAPKVESAVVRLVPLLAPAYRARDESLFGRVVAAAFSQRRKTLRNSLGSYLSQQEMSDLSIAPRARAQELGIGDFVRISDYLSNRDRTVVSPVSFG